MAAEQDSATGYLLSSEANKEHLLASMKEIDDVKGISLTIEELKEKYLSLTDFSFAKSQENLKDYKGSLSDSVIEERRL